MGSITKSAVAEAEALGDVDLVVAEGTNDVNLQISQVETFINDKVDAIVLLPFDGAAMTDVATKAMNAGIPVINVDREFSSPFAARSTVLGDNYGMGVSAGTYICEQFGDKPDAVIAEIAGIDSLPLTQDRSKGFSDALADCGLKVSNRVAAEFTVESGEAAASNLLQAAPKIDGLWNHDDDQGVGVMAAIKNAGRSEFIMVGGAGSANVMRDIQADDTVLKATVIYPSTQAADGIRLARLLVQGRVAGRPGRGRGAARDQALRTGCDQGQRRPVPADRLRVLTRCWSRSVRSAGRDHGSRDSKASLAARTRSRRHRRERGSQ